MPIYLYIGEHDTTISNDAAKKVYDKLPGPKEFYNQTDISHGPFSHGILKNVAIKNIHNWF